MERFSGDRTLFSRGKRIEITRGTVLHDRHDPCRALGKVISGKLRLSRILSSGKELTLKEFQPGELFAELIVFTGAAFPGRLIAVEDSIVCEVSYSRLLEYLDDRQAMVGFISGIARKLTHLTDTIEIMSLKTVEERIALFLMLKNENDSKADIRTTVTGLAEQLGASREAVSRALSRMEEAGMIGRSGRTLHIADELLLESVFA